MSNFPTAMPLLTILLFASLIFGQQDPWLTRSSKNVTLTFDDLPTQNGFGKIASYRYLDFSSFRLLNTSSAAAAGHISTNDTYCATSVHNALIAHRAKTPSLWPRIALKHKQSGEAPFFSLHGMSIKPMNVSGLPICIFISAYGLDEHKAVRALDSLFACFPPQRQGGYVAISDILPGWGKAVNMIEIHAEAIVMDDEDTEWVDWPFCIDDLTIEVLKGEWEWPEPWWPDIIPLLPPLAPFKYDDQRDDGGSKSTKCSQFSERARSEFDKWCANGAVDILLSTEDLLRT